MAKIFYADKKPEKMNVGNPDAEKFQVAESWGNTIRPLLELIGFVHSYRIYRPFRFIHPKITSLFGHLFGVIALGRSKSIKLKIESSFKALFPGKLSKKRLYRLYRACLKYLGSIFLDVMFHLPLTLEKPIGTYFKIKNRERFDEALSQGKGVIILMTHTGNYLHIPSALIQYPGVTLSAVASTTNMIMFQNLNRPSLENVYIYSSTEFSKIAQHMEEHLKSNHVLLITLDYSTPRQLRTPFMKNFPYLIHTPQAYLNLHRKTGAILLPMISYPVGSIGKSVVEFLDNSSIMESSKKYWNAPKKKFHGILSSKINSILYSFVRKYAHLWEEIMNFSKVRIADKIRFSSKTSMHEYLEQTFEKMKVILENSFEPGRKDEEILKIINEKFMKIIDVLKKPEVKLRNHKTKIDLSYMNGISELLKLCKIAVKELKLKKEPEATVLMQELKEKIEIYI